MFDELLNSSYNSLDYTSYVYEKVKNLNII